MAEACLQREHILLWSRDRRTLGPELGRGIWTFPRWTAPWLCWRSAAPESLGLTGCERESRDSCSSNETPIFNQFQKKQKQQQQKPSVTFLLCCSLVDCWFRRLSISMSKWDDWLLLLLPFFSVPLPDAEGPGSEEEAGVSDVVDEWGGEAELWSEGEKPAALLLCIWSSAFLLTPVLWAPATDPIIAQSFVWSTATTTVGVDVEEEVVEEEGAEVGSRTSMSSWAENLSSRLWMQPWLTAVSDCDEKQTKQRCQK